MKQYKFKYKGKWYDISSTVFGNYHATAHKQYNLSDSRESYFQVMEPTLPKLLKELKDRNIEVAEVCDRLRFKRKNRFGFDSNTFFFQGKKVFYNAWAFPDNGGFSVRLMYLNKQKNRVCLYKLAGYFDTDKAAKAACQADFQKRRAR